MHRLKLEILMAMLCRLLGSLLGSVWRPHPQMCISVLVCCVVCRRAARTSVGAGGVAASTPSVYPRTHAHRAA